MKKTGWNGFKELWGESSWVFKVITGIGFFFTVSAVTSLADTVFAWKGFIKDGVDFYRVVLMLPLRESLEKFNLQISQVEADYLVFLGMFSLTAIRGFRMISKDFKDKFSKYFIPIALPCFYIYFFFLTALTEVNDDILWRDLLTLTFFLFFPLLHLERSKRIEYIKPSVYLISFVFILAAINKGLTTPYP